MPKWCKVTKGKKEQRYSICLIITAKPPLRFFFSSCPGRLAVPRHHHRSAVFAVKTGPPRRIRFPFRQHSSAQHRGTIVGQRVLLGTFRGYQDHGRRVNLSAVHNRGLAALPAASVRPPKPALWKPGQPDYGGKIAASTCEVSGLRRCDSMNMRLCGQDVSSLPCLLRAALELYVRSGNVCVRVYTRGSL